MGSNSSNLIEGEIILRDSYNHTYLIKTVKVTKGFRVFKGAPANMNENTYEEYIRDRTQTSPIDRNIPSWYGLKDTAESYAPTIDKRVYEFEFTRDATFIDLTDKNTVINLFNYAKAIIHNNKWIEEFEEDLNIMTGVICPVTQTRFIAADSNWTLKEQELALERARLHPEEISRMSYAEIDLKGSKKLCHVFLSYLPGMFDGYLGKPCRDIEGGQFHSEIMSCNYKDILKLVGSSISDQAKINFYDLLLQNSPSIFDIETKQLNSLIDWTLLGKGSHSVNKLYLKILEDASDLLNVVDEILTTPVQCLRLQEIVNIRNKLVRIETIFKSYNNPLFAQIIEGLVGMEKSLSDDTKLVLKQCVDIYIIR